MTKYWKDGHWRTSINGDTHWVSGHWVSRENWDRQSYLQDSTDYGNSLINMLNKRQFDEFTKSATCPICGAEVYFVRHNGGCVWLDSLGLPWPKHPCFDDPDEVLFSSTKKELYNLGIDYFGIVTDVKTNFEPPRHKLVIKCSNGEVIEGLFHYKDNVENWLGQLVVIHCEYKKICIDNIFLSKIFGQLFTANNHTNDSIGVVGEALQKALNKKI